MLALATSCQDTIDELSSIKTVSGSLNAANVVPAVAVASSAKGDVTGTYTGTTRELSYLVAYGGLTGGITGASFYYSDARHRTATPLASFPTKTTSSGTGQFTDKATLTPQQADSLLAGRIYFSISTAKNPNGEIRGTVVVN